jgi:hypothetical protein
MSRSLVAATLAAAVAFVALAAPAHAESPSRAKPAALHYRTLEKMLRRFSRQAGTPSSGGVVYAAR